MRFGGNSPSAEWILSHQYSLENDVYIQNSARTLLLFLSSRNCLYVPSVRINTSFLFDRVNIGNSILNISEVLKRDFAEAQKVFAEVANLIAKYEPMTILVNQDQYVNARNMLGPKVRVIEMSNNDSWVRDSGPSFVVNDKGTVRGIDWGFIAYGGLVEGIYYPWDFCRICASFRIVLEFINQVIVFSR